MLTRPATETAEVTIAEATLGTYQTTVTATGTVEPSRQADLDFAVSGRVIDVAVEPGDTVKAGAALARLDTAALDAELASAKARLFAAETTAAGDADESSIQRAAHDAEVASGRAALLEAEQNLDAATLRATLAGTVGAVTVEVGDQAGGGASSAGGTAGGGSTSVSAPAVTVIKPTTFVVEADVAAADIDQVSEDLQVTIAPSGAAEDIYGTVTAVGRIAEAEDASGAATFPVTVTVTGKREDLYAGTSADISIIVKQIPDVLTVPTLAVRSDDGTTYVDKVEGSKAERTPVEVGETYGAATEIVSGLVEGDRIQVAVPVEGGTRTRDPDTGRQGGVPGGFGDGQRPGGQGNVGRNP